MFVVSGFVFVVCVGVYVEVNLLHVVVLHAGAGVGAEDLTVAAGVCVPADTLAVLRVPGVGRAVEAGELVPGQVGETVTGAGVCQELLPGAAGVGAQGTLAPVAIPVCYTRAAIVTMVHCTRIISTEVTART